MPEMTDLDVISFLDRMESLEIKIWVVGGWGVDALLGVQTRPHDDLDIVIQSKDMKKARKVLVDIGYYDIPRPDTSDWNFVMGDGSGHEIDFHVVVFDIKGNGLYGAEGKDVIYPPAGSLYDDGMINGHKVSCLTSEFTVEDHVGYHLRDKDFQDVKLLCEKFAIALPEEYRINADF